jgi:hypothetical protein
MRQILLMMVLSMCGAAHAGETNDLRARVVQLEGKAIAAEGDMRRLRQDVKRILDLLEQAQREKVERRPVYAAEYAADLEPIKVQLAELRYWRTAITWGAGVIGGMMFLLFGLVLRGLVRGEIRISRKPTNPPAQAPPEPA